MTFTFENYHFDQESKILTCTYSDHGHQFIETVNFSALPISPDIFSQKNFPQILDQACQGYFLIAGISYFKAFLSPEIKFSSQVTKKIHWTENKKNFFEKVYHHGLGEYFYENKIDPKGKINFPKKFSVGTPLVGTQGQTQDLALQGSLLPLGGGKDSLTSAHLLQKYDKKFTTWTVDSNQKFKKQASLIGVPHTQISRKISPHLIELNKSQKALNGHVPISAIWAFSSIISALLLQKKYVILSNEHSANEATRKYLGMDINHQYSKSLQFEKDFQNYLSENISKEIFYFSLLRPLREIQIAKIFCQENLAEKFLKNFSSCNRNFHITKKTSQNIPTDKGHKGGLIKQDLKGFFWCGKCPKCAFVSSIFAPHLKPENLWKIFNGKNLFTDPKLKKTFLGLLGFEEEKPFECVGEITEVRYSLWQARKKFPEVLKFFPSNFSDKDLENFRPNQKFPHKIPQEFREIINNI